VNPIGLNRARLSKTIWESILDGAEEYPSVKNFLQDTLNRQEERRADADYNTGSINKAAAWLNFAIALKFNPAIIGEVGTFIGKSTLSLAYGMHINSRSDTVFTKRMILTCDYSNDIEVKNEAWGISVEQFRKQASIDMFCSMHERNIHADLLYIDGRLNKEDLEIIPKVVHEHTVFVFDDCEGLEKGIINLLNLAQISDFAGYTLVYPPETETLRKYGLYGYAYTGMLIPNTLIKITNQ